MTWFLANACSLACVAASAWLCMNEKNGWGWFLFVAVMTCSCVSDPKEDVEEPKLANR
tara:strand:- start:3025 stop:3198 length:174 start_codon:yes stop_codon:yes gene_type:complete